MGRKAIIVVDQEENWLMGRPDILGRSLVSNLTETGQPGSICPGWTVIARFDECTDSDLADWWTDSLQRLTDVLAD